VHPSLLALGLNTAGDAVIAREAMRTKPHRNNSRDAYGDLAGTYDSYMRDMKPDVEPQPITLRERVPEDTLSGKYDAYANTGDYISSGNTPNGNARITINPNADRSMFAHELGHVASQQTDVGGFIRRTRNNPQLKRALTQAALLTVPAGAIAAFNPGDDDTAASIALSLAAASPTILDEMSATRHGLAIMDQAGMRANLGQRGKLAGGLLSYMAAPVAIGGLANLTGNLVDEEPKSPGELPVS
jgi:hypothetical protein